MNIFGPGNLGSFRGSLLTAIHADWPAYPEGEDYKESLLRMSIFPSGVELKIVDDIDRCFLLVATCEQSKIKDPYHDKHIHVCVMYDDLFEMLKNGFVEGVEPVNEYHWRKHEWDTILADNNCKEMFYKDQQGNLIKCAPLHESCDPDDDEIWFLISPNRRIELTESGRVFIHDEICREKLDFGNVISRKVLDLYTFGFYDTSIREACALLETKIKAVTGTSQFGASLLEEFVGKIRENSILESFVRNYRQEIRLIFKYIRNDFMHNVKDIDQKAAYSMLFRIAKVMDLVNHLEK